METVNGAGTDGGERRSGARTSVAVLGATGIVGQRLVHMLARHPWFRLAEVAASRRRVGRRYADTVRWSLADAMPVAAGELSVKAVDEPLTSRLILSALPRSVAAGLEPSLAEAGHVVCTNASAHRLNPAVPLLIPELNAHHLGEWSGVGAGGALVANPNCVVAGLALALAPLERAFGIRRATVVTLQALSGAGLSGLGAVETADNVIPWISGEEEKIGPEVNKILDSRIEVVACTNRVPVLDGHMAHAFLTLNSPASPKEAMQVLRNFRAPADLPSLPTLPRHPVVVRTEPDRPQLRLDIAASEGMSVSVGRIRSAPPHDLALVAVVHNGVRGAAGACLANAELCAARGLVDARVRSAGAG